MYLCINNSNSPENLLVSTVEVLGVLNDWGFAGKFGTQKEYLGFKLTSQSLKLTSRLHWTPCAF